jgi:hypothetical protein
MLLSRVCKDAGAPGDDQYHIIVLLKVQITINIVLLRTYKEVDNLYGMGRTRSTLHRKAYVHKTKVAVEEMYIYLPNIL